MTQNRATEPAKKLPVPWWRTHGFILGLVGAVVLAFLFPEPGSRGGSLHADVLNNAGIALILFLQGLSLALEQVKRGAGNWRLHAIIQAFTFVIFPVVGLLFNFVGPLIWASEPEAIRNGFLYLCVLPSTISTSVVLTAVARGNTAGALFNAALSNIVGVIATPLLVQLLMNKTGAHGDFGPLLLKITLLTLLPFALGMILRRWLHAAVDRRKIWVTRISNAVILFIVYAAFCDSVQQRIWQQHGAALTVKVALLVASLFVVMSALVYAACRSFRLGREDLIAAYFCSVKKTLAMGVPLAVLIFGERADLPLILLPIMFYHPLQLFVNGLMANRWAKQAG
ncbi:bile acid:sodium symporter family protein [Oleiharenicola lentus]|uniref:bile acid:sodium symporter family protein n=1 Tax=Oleiharenicola lentus TaxID=2508720 RepID=UPI003F67A9F2